MMELWVRKRALDNISAFKYQDNWTLYVSKVKLPYDDAVKIKITIEDEKKNDR